jgi:hypothetical protein
MLFSTQKDPVATSGDKTMDLVAQQIQSLEFKIAAGEQQLAAIATVEPELAQNLFGHSQQAAHLRHGLNGLDMIAFNRITAGKVKADTVAHRAEIARLESLAGLARAAENEKINNQRADDYFRNR